MSDYIIIYDDEELTAYWVTADELSKYLNAESGFFKGYKILDDFPRFAGSAFDLWGKWPDNSMLIFKDGAIYVPRKITTEVTMQVERWEVE